MAMLPNGPVSYQNGSFVPTFHLSPPSFETSAGGQIKVLFDLLDFQGIQGPNVTVPAGFSSQVLLHPFDVEPRSTMDNLCLIAVSSDSNVTRGTYKVTVSATANAVSPMTGSISFERSFFIVIR
jgi:hypothetical protein